MVRINEMFGDKYNGILVNRYVTDNDTNDYIGAHSDDESNLGTGGVIGVIYGITRKFHIRDKATKKIVCDADVPNGAIVWTLVLFCFLIWVFGIVHARKSPTC